ncbi:hypothetical protein P153DRAFT_299688 [Dothidotthia symphoricarpi CBS 119687]|uniref:DUF1996 domain-containing protein n=1 Tax=Dothidotthia symphoricarpi CBS 119687 TaxID=1392245 RepID=A0A6A6A0F0_9PLEO|nr:uncharacterized protein P153DRAFT_299688 [Dothidotthia symphoricarpi CBS 119687]KAF2125280.1 hypothetical protein P153DRAFT_299688 [Dothidotthia symphoricarpi CBS 119687]
MKSYTTISATVALLSGTTEAFWRMPCHSRTAFARLDPIVDPGVASSHVHAIHGGSNFAETTTYDMLRDSNCTSCQFSDDKSAYWTPSLHFIHTSGKTEVVPQVGGMLAYYLLLGEDLKAFPEGFQMLAGDGQLRNFTGPVPDLPTSSWTSDDKTQVSLGQKSLGFNCLNYAKNPEGSRYRHFLPDKSFMDENCADGIRAEIFFPSCWNGKDVKSADHKSHMAYPDLIDGGNCPKGYETRLPSLFYETIWNTYAFKGIDGQFTWSNGDPTGYGYHADFMNGWNINTLQSAVDDCTNASGRVEDCSHFTPSLQTEAEQGMCYIEDMPSNLKNDDCDGPSDGLCGNVPIQFGPKYATALENGNTEAQTATVKPSVSVSVPTLSYASASSEATDKWGGGVSVYSSASSEAAYSSDAAYSSEAAYSTEESAAYAAAVTSVAAAAESAAAPLITPSPSSGADAAQTSDCSTTTYTKDGILYEIAIEEVTVTVTQEAGYKARRHANAHRRRSNVGQH